jgi:hypothetical protein
MFEHKMTAAERQVRRHMRAKPVDVVTSVVKGRGTADVVRHPRTNALTCSCGVPNCIHLAQATIAVAAGVKVIDPGTVYEVVKAFESESRPGSFYTVKRKRATGELSCNCRGWILAKKKSGRPCWHVQRVEEAA